MRLISLASVVSQPGGMLLVLLMGLVAATLGGLLGARSLTDLMTIEMGKPLKAAVEQAAKCAWACRYYAEHAERFLADEDVATNTRRSYIHYQAARADHGGDALELPVLEVFRFDAPALLAGNV